MLTLMLASHWSKLLLFAHMCTSPNLSLYIASTIPMTIRPLYVFFPGAYAGFLVYISISEYLYLCIMQEKVDRTFSRGRNVFCHYFFFRTKVLSTWVKYELHKVPGNKVTALGGEVSRVFLCSSGWFSNLRSSSLYLLIIGVTGVCYHIWLEPQHLNKNGCSIVPCSARDLSNGSHRAHNLVFVLLLAS